MTPKTQITSISPFASVHNDAKLVLPEKSSDVTRDRFSPAGAYANGIFFHSNNRSSSDMHPRSPSITHPSGNLKKCKFGMDEKFSAWNFRFRLPPKSSILVFADPCSTTYAPNATPLPTFTNSESIDLLQRILKSFHMPFALNTIDIQH